jgi:hypothetical protein
MKAFKSSVRVWFAALFISAAALCAIWAQQPVGPSGGTPTKSDTCWAVCNGCLSECVRERKGGSINARELDGCTKGCFTGYHNCMLAPAITGGAGASGKTPPPRALGPNSTPSPSPAPTPRRHPSRLPSKSGPSPSATASPTLRSKPANPSKTNKPASPTPSPSSTPKKNSHGHHSG